MLLNLSRLLSIFAISIFPIFYIPGLAFPSIVPHVLMLFLVIEIVAILFVFHSIKQGIFTFKKSHIVLGLLFYVLALFYSALVGVDFSRSFWSSYSRMTGLVTISHLVLFAIILPSIFEKKDWLRCVRCLSISTLLLALGSLFGSEGFRIDLFTLSQGGSWLGNTIYSGIFFSIIFFLIITFYGYELSTVWKRFYAIVLVAILLTPEIFNFKILTGQLSLGSILENPFEIIGTARASSIIVYFGIILFAFLYVLHKNFSRKVAVRLLIVTFILLSSFYVYVFNSILMKEGVAYELHVAHEEGARLLVWDSAISGISERPWFGYGIENFNYIYERNLKPEALNLEGVGWFDRAHNVVLEHLAGSGIVGTVLLLVVFVCILYRSFIKYEKNGDLVLVFIPFIFLLYFFEIQTSFITDSGLVMVLFLVAYVVSYEESWSIKINKVFARYIKGVCIGLFFVSVYLFVWTPFLQNLLIVDFAGSQNHEQRMKIYEKMDNLYVYPVQTVRTMSRGFSSSALKEIEYIEESGLDEDVMEEYKALISWYDENMDKYSDNYRFLIDYANLINAAYLFGYDDLEKGEELTAKALEISGNYPHPYWALVVNYHNRGLEDKALEAINKAYDLNPDLDHTKDIKEKLETDDPIFIDI